MTETQEGIVGIYTYTHASYYLTYLFNESGLIDNDFLQDLYGQTYTLGEIDGHSSYIGPFDDLDALNKFAFKICDELRSERIVLHSLDEYNSIMDGVNSVNELKEKLITEGNVIENLEMTNKKGILGKFFKK